MNHHKGVEPPIIEKPLRSKVMKDVCKDPFDADFIDRIGDNRQALYDLILGIFYNIDAISCANRPKRLHSTACVCVCVRTWLIFTAANYMDIKSLLHLGCAKVASLIKGQPLEKIKDILSTGAKTEEKKEEKKEEKSEEKKEEPKK
jgi:hypothetical protein